MFGKLYHTVAIVSIAITLAGGALIGLLCATGKLTSERIDAIAEILRGTAAGVDNVETAGTTSQVREQHAAGASGDLEADEESKGRSEDEIRRQQRENQIRRALSERTERDVIAQRELLDRALQQLITEQERFEEQQALSRAELEKRRGAASDEGFQRELKIVSKLSPKLAKEHLVRKWNESPADAVRLVSTLPDSTSKRILGQMKTPEEMQIMHELLERLAQERVDTVKPTSGRTAGD